MPLTTDFMAPDVVAAAINAATLAAIKKARQTNTLLVVSDEKGNVREITPDEAEAQFNRDLAAHQAQ